MYMCVYQHIDISAINNTSEQKDHYMIIIMLTQRFLHNI